MAIDVLPRPLVRWSAPALASLRGARIWLRQRTCALTGHDYRIRARDDRMLLRCEECGHETAGWTIRKPGLKPGR